MKIKSIIKQKWKTTRGKTPSLRVDEIVAIKIDKVDKTSPQQQQQQQQQVYFKLNIAYKACARN